MEKSTYSNILEIGYKLGSYEIIDKLGEGGFGITYKAKHVHLETIVVIKEYMPASMAVRDRDSISITVTTQDNVEGYKFGLEKFLSEAKILASFKHPNIVGINDFFEANNTAYFVMPFVEGITLGDHVDKMSSALKEEEVLKLLLPILEGLKESHSKEVLHRDIKPDNIFLTEDGTPILIDFGAARIDFAQKSESINAVLTPPYAPPEQYGSSTTQGPWTDIYALGMVLYKLVTNFKSSDIPSSIDRATAIYSGDEDPLAAMENPNFSASFKELILKALNIKAKERFATAAEMIEACHALNSQNISQATDVTDKTMMYQKPIESTDKVENTLQADNTVQVKKPSPEATQFYQKEKEITIIREEAIEEPMSLLSEKKSNKTVIGAGIFGLLVVAAGAFCFLSDACQKDDSNTKTEEKSEKSSSSKSSDTETDDIETDDTKTDDEDDTEENDVKADTEMSADKAFKKAKKLLDNDVVTEAEEYFKIASNQGHIKSKVYLGQIAESRKNFKDAKKYYYEASKKDDLEGEFFYAEMMKVDNNLAKAEYWYKKSAKQGHLKAKFMLGEIAFVADQYGDAQKYYEEILDSKELEIDDSIQTPKTITKKNDNAIKLNLTYIYFKIDKDNKKAKKIVPRDIPMGQAYLGQILLNEGKRKEAKKWMKKSAKNGYAPAKAFLKDNF